jgi:poly(A) polymerase
MSAQGQHLRDAAVGIVRRLRGAGHVAYLAGGCVRDALLGVQPQDYDVATDARPEAVRKLFRRSRYVGEAFGVVLVYERGHPFEVATFRTEWGYEDGRRPGGVEFTDAEHDARRRDFTVNGLFADPLDEKLDPAPAGKDRVIDYVGGVKDLEARVLRAIGDPGERFREDYLRMLRAARFAARLGFEIDPGTAEAVRTSAEKLAKISRERIGQEVRLMLTGTAPARAASLMQALRIDGPTLNEGCLDAPSVVLGALPGGSGYALSLAAWMLDRAGASGSVEDAARFIESEAKPKLRGWRRALCLSNGDRDALGHLLSLLPRVKEWEGLGVAKRKRLLAEPGWADAWTLVRVLGPAAFVERVEAEAAPLLAEGVAPQRYVTGDDLLAMGVRAGPRIGDILEAVYDAQLEGKVRNKDEGLRWVREREGRAR